MAYTQSQALATSKLELAVTALAGGSIKYLAANDDVLVSIGLGTPALGATQVGTLNVFATAAAPVSGGTGAAWAGFLADVAITGDVDRVAFCNSTGDELAWPAVGTDWTISQVSLVQGESVLFSAAPVLREPFAE